ncbi:hypothetical protein SAMN05444166_8284 [Singulisphaera sp. GP187]|nr:hypothetical protein SAMN05444166_8284 [Singulisphaera sp. GP187]
MELLPATRQAMSVLNEAGLSFVDRYLLLFAAHDFLDLTPMGVSRSQLQLTLPQLQQHDSCDCPHGVHVCVVRVLGRQQRHVSPSVVPPALVEEHVVVVPPHLEPGRQQTLPRHQTYCVKDGTLSFATAQPNLGHFAPRSQVVRRGGKSGHSVSSSACATLLCARIRCSILALVVRFQKLAWPPVGSAWSGVFTKRWPISLCMVITFAWWSAIYAFALGTLVGCHTQRRWQIGSGCGTIG